ncbi:hypothetical protein B0H21DRAFT_707938 [Amylocystis lapponica]|nr:hypothetical protein B0H21DRAFT_707938 [Amylocystis lapponica]
MAPSFLSKFVKSPSHSTSGSRSREPSPSPSPPSRNPTISISSVSSSVSSIGRPRRHTTVGSGTPSGDESDSYPNVTVVPPSPQSTSQNSLTDEDPASLFSNNQAQAPRRRLPSLPNMSPGAASPSSEEEGLATPTPATRTTFQDQASTVDRSLTKPRSNGNIREMVNTTDSRSANPLRSVTMSDERSQQSSNGAPVPVMMPVQSKASNKMQLKLDNPVRKESQNRHDRSASVPSLPSPPHNITITEHGVITTSPVEDSPTDLPFLSPSESVQSRSMSASSTLPNISATFLLPDTTSDAASLRSVSSTGTSNRKKKSWHRRDTNATAPPAPRLTSPSSASLSPKRKPTTGGLASALAQSGLAMAGMSLPISPDFPPTPPTSSSLSSRPRRSSDNPRTPPSARSRRTSISYAHSDLSDRDSFHSGQEIGSSSEDDDLGLDPDDIPVTGFAVASNKRNQDFHELFPTIPEGDYLIEDYGCALQREILIQGRLYISENHICFHANIFGWITDLSIPMYEVTTLDKRMTAFVIPNAIQITTTRAKYTFTSFLSRDTTFDVIYNVWKLARPEEPSGSLDMLHNQSEEGLPVANGLGPPVVLNGTTSPKKSPPKNKVTQCECGRLGQHLSEVAMESVLPGTPEKIYNLMFTSGFMKDFMRDDQKLLDIQISDWMPMADPHLLARNMSYIKPLSGGIGPKQTKCELRDETVHCDFDEYVVMLTTTRTPDVPSGGVFSVKTRTCITWASSASTKVLVTTQVEWTGRSFIKGIIEKSAIDGQKTYHVDLDRAMRHYIRVHQSELIPEGVDASIVEEAEAQVAESPKAADADKSFVSDDDVRKSREHERNQRGLQWAYDTVEGALKVTKQSTEGALDLLSDAWDQSSSTTILYFVIGFLVVSNAWTLTLIGKREDVGRRKEMRKMEEREQWVQGIVTGLWDELIANRNILGSSALSASSNRPVGNAREEVGELTAALDMIEDRVGRIRESLRELD